MSKSLTKQTTGGLLELKQSLLDESSILRLGGIAGIFGGVIFILVPVVLFGFVPPTPSDPAAVVQRWPSVSSAVTLGNNLNLVSDIFVLGLFLTLYRALKKTSLAPALFGAVLSVLGLAVLFTETQTQVAFAPISDLYHAPGATLADQRTLALMWQATQGMFFELDVAAGLLLSIGLIVLGVAVLQSPAYGRRLGWTTVVLGAVSLLGISMIPVYREASIVAVLALPVYVVLPILLGWKTYKLSKGLAQIP